MIFKRIHHNIFYELKGGIMKNLAVGYFNNQSFKEVCSPWTRRIKEVFFAWPGMLSCRPPLNFNGRKRDLMLEELQWCRRNNIALDTLFNCNCYGEEAVGKKMADSVKKSLDEMCSAGLFPDIATTTSPFIAETIKRIAPAIEVRASVNMRIHGTIGFEYISSTFDSFYVSREHQRDPEYMKTCAAWAEKNGKKLGMQLNSGCLRQCPYQQFHDNMHGHNRELQSARGAELGFDVFLCRKHFSTGHHEDFLRGTWIRPEDTVHYEPFVSVMKISTRKVPCPQKIVDAYAGKSFRGNLAEIMDPDHSAVICLDNAAFPHGWNEGPVAQKCAENCVHCGKCTELLHSIAGRTE